MVSKALSRGFTLIELMVVVGIIMLVGGGALANFNRYHEDQKVRQSAATLKNNLRLAQQQAVSGKKPASGCTSLVGYQIQVSTSGYTMQAVCTEGAAGEETTVLLPVGVTFSPLPASPLTFRVLDGSVDGAGTMTIVGQSVGARITVSSNGDIVDNGTFQP